jgi:hypothetical protein
MISTEDLIEERRRIDEGADCGLSTRDLIQHHIDANNVIKQRDGVIQCKNNEIADLRERIERVRDVLREAGSLREAGF